MKTTHFLFAMLGAMAILTSCSNDDTNAVPSSYKHSTQVEVVNLSDYLPSSRSNDKSMSSEKVLKFSDINSLHNFMSKVSNMNDEAVVDYYKSIGFDGAYTTLCSVDNKLDSFFDVDDSNQFIKSVQILKEQNKNVITFNTADETDLTPSLPKRSEDMNLVCSKNGYVVLGNRLISDLPLGVKEYVQTRAGLEPVKDGFRSFPGKCSFTISQGRYESRITLGYSPLTKFMGVKVTSFKVKHIFGVRYKKRYDTEYHSDVYLNGAHYRADVGNRHRGEDYTYLMPAVLSDSFKGKKVSCEFKNFYSECCPTSGNNAFVLDLTYIK